MKVITRVKLLSVNFIENKILKDLSSNIDNIVLTASANIGVNQLSSRKIIFTLFASRSKHTPRNYRTK